MKVVRLARRAMATVFELTLVGRDEDELRSAGEAALRQIDRIEDQLSLFLPTSEISRINELAAAGPVALEPRLEALLRRALELGTATGGAFDVTVGSLMRARGFRPVEPGAPSGALESTGTDRVRLVDGHVTFRHPETALDLGAIGKGWAIDRAVAVLRRHEVESAFLHGGWSTLYALGSPPDAAGWTVGLVDPASPERRIGALTLRDRALSVSGRDGRRAGYGSDARSHVVDPRSGGEPRRGVAWAAADDATTADALSTAFLLLPAPAIEALCAREGHGAVLLMPRPRAIHLDVDLAAGPRRPAEISRRRFLSATAAAAAAFSVGLPRRLPGQPSALDEVDLAVVGLGEQGKLLLSQLVRLPGVRVRAVCDLRQAALDESLEITGRNTETYLDHRHLLDVESVDGVVVATPTHRHAPVALDALARGLSVYCEAPMARTLEDCRAMARAAAESGVIFQVGHQRRWSRLYPHALQHFRTGSIGRLVRLSAQWNRRDSWRRPAPDRATDRAVNWRLHADLSGGLLLEQGSHVFDLAAWLLDAGPEAVAGFGGIRQWRDWRDVDDTVQVSLRYPEGIQLAFEATLAASYGGEQERIFGTAGTMLLLRQAKGLLFKESDSVAAGWEAFARQELFDDRRGIVLDPEATRYVADEPEISATDADRPDFYAALAAFADSIRTGTPPLCGAREGLAAAATALVALEAVETATLLDVPGEVFDGP